MWCRKCCERNSEYQTDILDLVSDQILNSDIRDVCYSALVKDIVENNRESQKLKRLFFYIVCFIFVFTCCAGMTAVCIIAIKEDIAIEDITVVISAICGVLGSIIVLPTTIARHLFPEDSEKARFSFIKGNRDIDVSLIGAATDAKEVHQDNTVSIF